MSRGTALWLGFTVALALLACWGWTVPREALDWQPARALSQPWRAWTAAFVHWSPWHLAANLIGCAVVAAFATAAQVPPRATLAWFVAWPIGHVALALQPALTSYGGLSGTLHGGVAIAGWHLLRHEQGRRRTIGIAVLAGLTIKLLLEAPWAAPMLSVPGWDFPVAPLAHATGALAGLGCAWLADRLSGKSP